MRQGNLFKQRIMVGRETNRVYWRTVLHDTKAGVTSSGGTFKTVDTNEFFVFSKTSSQLILIRTVINCVEVIIINPETGNIGLYP
jgi:hypothetical protein